MLSFGNGMRLGRIQEPAPRLQSLAPASGALRLHAAPGQRAVWSRSTDLLQWRDLRTNLVNQAEILLADPESDGLDRAYYKARVE